MGWDFTYGLDRAGLIDRLMADRGDGWKTLAHSCVGNVLWAVRETPKGERFIGCFLMRSQRGFGYGYKGMDESMGPYYYSCPLKYLDMAPVACEEWRTKVRAYHVERAIKRASAKGNVAAVDV